MPMLHYCESCQDKSAYTLISKHIRTNEEPPEEYTFAFCETCKNPSVFIREDLGSENGFEDDSYYKVYPADERHIRYSIPEIVRKSYNEAVRCEISKIPNACVVMVGRTLEAVIKEHIPQSPTIFKGLEEMKKQGLISEELFNWSQKLRALRNAGAHATTTDILPQEASEAIDFLQAILEILYHLRPKFKYITERK